MNLLLHGPLKSQPTEATNRMQGCAVPLPLWYSIALRYQNEQLNDFPTWQNNHSTGVVQRLNVTKTNSFLSLKLSLPEGILLNRVWSLGLLVFSWSFKSSALYSDLACMLSAPRLPSQDRAIGMPCKCVRRTWASKVGDVPWRLTGLPACFSKE